MRTRACCPRRSASAPRRGCVRTTRRVRVRDSRCGRPARRRNHSSDESPFRDAGAKAGPLDPDFLPAAALDELDGQRVEAAEAGTEEFFPVLGKCARMTRALEITGGLVVVDGTAEVRAD